MPVFGFGFFIGLRSGGFSGTFTETEPSRGFGWFSTSMCLMCVVRIVGVGVTSVFIHAFKRTRFSVLSAIFVSSLTENFHSQVQVRGQVGAQVHKLWMTFSCVASASIPPMISPICSWDPHRPIRENRMDYESHGGLENLDRGHEIRGGRLDNGLLEHHHRCHSAG